jgi:hypothetical protein
MSVGMRFGGHEVFFSIHKISTCFGAPVLECFYTPIVVSCNTN